MTRDEIANASMALARWFESQDISMVDAVPVMAITMAACIKICAPDRTAKSEREGVELVIKMMNEAMEKIPGKRG